MNSADTAIDPSTIKMMTVNSSQIHSIGHDQDSNTLAIRFKSKAGPGSLYHYVNFSAADFALFWGAESKGSYFKRHIKPAVEKWPFRKVPEIGQ